VCTTNINKIEYSGSKKKAKEVSPLRRQEIYEVDLSRTCSP
jgi:hypothetical protein